MTDASSRCKALILRLAPFGIFLGASLLVAVTAADYGVAWDEPHYFRSSDLHVQWLGDVSHDLVQGQISKSIQDDRIKAAWRSDPYYVPHPPFSRIISGATKAILFPTLDKFVSYRVGPALFFALLATVMYVWMAELFSPLIGTFSVLTLVAIPNLFGMAHLAVTDTPLAAMWFLTAYCFWKGLENWKWSLALGIVWGLALATKFPALLIPIPLLLWAHLFRRDSYANNIIAMIFIGPLVMIAVQPYLWHQPFLRILEFLYEGVSRGYRPETNYPVYFFGQAYYSSELPKYYPFFLMAITTPETILGLSLCGIVFLVRHSAQRKVVMLFLINALFILSMGALPGAVLHDGMRQMLSAYAFIAGLAAAGFSFLTGILRKAAERITSLQSVQRLEAKLISILAILLLFPPLLDLVLYHPFELSYYNRFVGGIRGAYERGLEVTYFMEAITPEFLKYLNRKLPPNAIVNGLFSNFMLEYYQQEGRLRRDIKITEQETFDYAVVLNRRSIVTSMSRKKLLDFVNAKTQPYASVSLGGVPLVLVYQKRPS